jgi:thymidylate kinase
MDKEKAWEEYARILYAHLKTNIRYDRKFLPRPFFLEFTGSPSSGKTTTITELDKVFRRQGLRVLRPQEGAEVIRHIGRDTPVYNIRTGLYALQQLIDFSNGHQYDIVIFDRCIFDVFCWMMYWEGKGKLREDEKSLIQSFFLSRFWAHEIDAAYFMVANPEVAMSRELRIASSKKMGETTNPQSIATLVERYTRAYERLSPQYPQLHFLDTSNLSEQEMIDRITAEVFEILKQKAQNSH